MSSPESKHNEEDRDASIDLSVQGQYFIVKKSIIESYDWILSKILSSEIPWKKTSDNGQYFLDVDPTSFRIVLDILKGTFDSSTVTWSLSRAEHAIQKSTARYLMLDDIYEELSAFETGIVEEYNTKLRQKQEQIAKEEIHAFDLKHKADMYDQIERNIGNLGIKVVQCRAYQTHRSFNQCGALSIIIGSASPEDNLHGPCGVCANDCSRLRGLAQFEYRQVNLDGFIKKLRNMNDEYELMNRDLERMNS